MGLRKLSVIILCIIVIGIGSTTARLLFPHLSFGRKSHGLLDNKRIDLLQRAPFSFQKDIVNSISGDCIHSKPQFIDPLREVIAEYFAGAERYKETTTLKAILRVADEEKITPAQRDIINNLVVEFELATSQKEASRILKAIKKIAGHRFGVDVYLSRETSLTNR